ncbi:hypothetical protein [Rhizobium lentis]|uniref:Uncharacterized protein n=1 Tax=Rhizobium lentis TaxID=1138194 RepID=A0A7W8UQ09_9HYPH|nr:hypothetical protein [Rhizobium lentis]MBB4574714.1 hypothetical protein [Rhizobium lentis]MBB5550641.1 hypothetical protein [Rhizobium lentis]MBB5561237.1 hypothetical protein [Rhizobium lentis]MBB5567760.1 hypothetical protein [Rhizobium lentis]
MYQPILTLCLSWCIHVITSDIILDAGQCFSRGLMTPRLPSGVSAADIIKSDGLLPRHQGGAQGPSHATKPIMETISQRGNQGPVGSEQFNNKCRLG